MTFIEMDYLMDELDQFLNLTTKIINNYSSIQKRPVVIIF